MCRENVLLRQKYENSFVTLLIFSFQEFSIFRGSWSQTLRAETLCWHWHSAKLGNKEKLFQVSIEQTTFKSNCSKNMYRGQFYQPIEAKHTRSNIWCMAEKVPFCFSSMCAQILLNISGYIFCAKLQILTEFWQKVLSTKSIENGLYKSWFACRQKCCWNWPLHKECFQFAKQSSFLEHSS